MDSSHLEKKINSQISEFDILALLRVLKHGGYNECQMYFHSYDNMASQSSLLHHVELKDDRIDIFLNTGLLTSIIFSFSILGNLVFSLLKSGQ